MAELSVGRVVTVAALAGALVGGAVAAGVAVTSSSGNPAGGALAGRNPSLATAAVVRTDLTTTVQVGGAIGYAGSYTVEAPAGTSPQQVAQDQETVAEDEQALSADEQAAADTTSADNQALAADRATVGTDQAALSHDQAAEAKDCSDLGASSSACGQDAQKVSQDQAALAQATQQLGSVRATATSDHDQGQAKIQADQTKLAGDQSSLASAQSTETSAGTTYTALPTVGDVVTEDQSVYSVSNEAVPLLYGAIPAYRSFYVGMSDGADVGQLTHDLIALGDGSGLAQSDHYSAATAAAVTRWQRALGLVQSGEILLGDVVFEPGPIRVTSVTPSVGEAVSGGGGGGGSTGGSGGGGTVLTATSTTPIVTVDLAVTQESLVKPGDAVSIVLPGGDTTVGGRIETVGTVATCPGGGAVGTGTGGAGAADESPCESGGSGSSSTPTVTVTISMDRTPPGASLDQAPVNVDITSQRVDHVLAVPVDALLALQGGGFGVDVVTGKASHLVGVTTGLYSNTLVQVSGTGITAGTRVEVPSP
jgi:hypothetical protein